VVRRPSSTLVMLVGGVLAVAAGTWFTLVPQPGSGSGGTPAGRLERVRSRLDRLTLTLPPTDPRVQYRDPPGAHIRGLEDSDPAIRSYSAWQLKDGEPTKEALVPLSRCLQDPDGEVRKAAAAALGEYAHLPPRVAYDLRRLVQADPSLPVSVRALWAVAGRRVPGVLEDAIDLFQTRGGNNPTGERSSPTTVLDAIARESPEGYRYLSGLCANQDPEMRRAAVMMMPTCREAWPEVGRYLEFLPGIEGLLQDPDSRVRSNAVWALKRLEVR